VRLLYGAGRDVAAGRAPSSWDPVLAIQQARSVLAASIGPELRFHRTFAARATFPYAPPTGAALIGLKGRQAYLRRGRAMIMVTASSPRLVRAGIRALTRSPSAP
jgi:hypothetical protein